MAGKKKAKGELVTVYAPKGVHGTSFGTPDPVDGGLDVPKEAADKLVARHGFSYEAPPAPPKPPKGDAPKGDAPKGDAPKVPAA